MFFKMEKWWMQSDFDWFDQTKIFNFIKENNIELSTIVDIGSGKGHALCLLSLYKFKKILGIELTKSYFDICLKNLKTFVYENNIEDNIFDIHNINATEFSFTEDINFIYLFNPFGGETFKKVCDNLVKSLNKNKREFYIIYKNGIHRNVLIDFNFKIIYETGNSFLLKYDPFSV